MYRNTFLLQVQSRGKRQTWSIIIKSTPLQCQSDMILIRKFSVICMSQSQRRELTWRVYLFVHILNFLNDTIQLEKETFDCWSSYVVFRCFHKPFYLYLQNSFLGCLTNTEISLPLYLPFHNVHDTILCNLTPWNFKQTPNLLDLLAIINSHSVQ